MGEHLRAGRPESRVSAGQWRRVALAPQRIDLRVAGRGPAAYRATRIYSPVARSRRVARRALALPAAGGIGRRVSPPVPDALELAHDLGLQQTTAVAARRSSADGRWLLSFSSRSAVLAVAKIGFKHDHRLRNEAEMLRAVTDRDVGVDAPHLVETGEWHDRYFLVTSPLGAEAVRVLDPVIAERIARRLSRPNDGGPALVHGDLTPWNLWREGATPVVIDWEAAALAFSPLWDLTMFVASAGAHFGTWSPEEAADMLTSRGGIGVQHLDALGVSPDSATSYVRNFVDQRGDASPPGLAAYLSRMRGRLR